MEILSKLKKHGKGIAKEYRKNVETDIEHGHIGNPVSDLHSMAMAPVQYAFNKDDDRNGKRGKK
jgi:hypothetical protein